MKKFLCLVLTLCIFAGVFTFVGCDMLGGGNDDPATVMNVSLNPEVEFVLDGNGKVITVNALNEEGNLIISAEEFEKIEGKTAEEAAQLFVQVCTDTGYLVSGSVMVEENEIKISISGDETAAEKLFNDVKAKVDTYLSEENITATLQKAAEISQEELQELVAECAPYLEEAEIKAMEYKELLAQLAESRKETAEYYSQELKTAYYEAKAHALDKAKFEVLKTKLSEGQAATLSNFAASYNKLSEGLENARKKWLVDEDSLYQKALAAVRTAKINYLKYLSEVSEEYEEEFPKAVENKLNELYGILHDAEQALVQAGETANSMFALTQTMLNTAYSEITIFIAGIDTDEFVDEIAEKQTSAANEFFTSFESNYASAKQSAQNAWTQMDAALRAPSSNN